MNGAQAAVDTEPDQKADDGHQHQQREEEIEENVGNERFAKRDLLAELDHDARARDRQRIDAPFLPAIGQGGETDPLLRHIGEERRAAVEADLAIDPGAKHMGVGIIIGVFIEGQLIVHIEVDVVDLLGHMVRIPLQWAAQQAPDDIGIVDELGIVDIVDLPRRAVEGEGGDHDDGHHDDWRNTEK